MSPNKLKRTFTLVELLAAITILAILATVLIVGYGNFTRKTKYSNDVKLVTEWNQLLDAKDVLAKSSEDEKLNNVIEVKDYFKENGTDDSNLDPVSSGYHFYWNELDNIVYLVEDDNDTFVVSYPKDEDNSIANAHTSNPDSFYRLDKEYYSVISDIEGLTVSPSAVVSNITTATITLSGDILPDNVNSVNANITSYDKATGKLVITNPTGNVAIMLNYLTFSSEGSFTLGATLGFTPTDDAYLQYSTDSSNWTKWDSTAVTSKQNGEKYFVYLRGKGLSSLVNTEKETFTNITLTPAGGLNECSVPYEDYELIDCSGNIMTLLNYDNPNDAKIGEFAFSGLFHNLNYDVGYGSPLRTAPSLVATTLAIGCYSGMFQCCTSLISAPKLPATTLAAGCYSFMFYGCTSLISAPALVATTLADSCYSGMFQCCTSLISAPSLAATTLADSCYSGMFQCCTSLISAPALVATTLEPSCYLGMFADCTSLISAPSLVATTLEPSCYCRMFYGCTSLKISTDGNENNKIFTCPSTIPDWAVDEMFVNTYNFDINSDINSIKMGITYYWYAE